MDACGTLADAGKTDVQRGGRGAPHVPPLLAGSGELPRSAHKSC